MKSNNQSGDASRQRREIMKPTLFPRKLHFWLKDYEMEANAKYGDASVFVFTEIEPTYAEDNFNTYIRGKLNLRTVAALNGLDASIKKMEQKLWFNKRTQYSENLISMFNDMMLHFSDESMNLIQAFRNEFDECFRQKDPTALLRLVKRSHTQHGRVASREEKESKKDRLKGHRQWDKNGKIHPIHDHNRVFTDLLNDTKEVGITWEDEDVVDMYLKSVDNTLIVADLARIKVEGSVEMPTTLEDAMFWVIETNRTNKAIKDNGPQSAGAKRKVPGDGEKVHHQAESSNKTSRENYVECTFCKKKHAGGAQECVYLKQLMTDHPEEVTETLAKKVPYPPSSSSSRRNRGRGGKGGKGGRGFGGRSSGNGRKGGKGRGRSDKGSNKSVNVTTNASAEDDTWSEFNKNQLDSVFHLKVTVFKSGKASMKQKQTRDTYLYDNGATCNLFCNENLMWDVVDTQPTRIDGIGNAYVTRRGVSLFGPAYLLTSLPFNIVAEQEVMANDKIKFISEQSPDYYVNNVKWPRQPNGLLTCTHAQAQKMVANRVAQDSLITSGQRDIYTMHYALALDALPDGTYYNAQQRRRAAAVRRIHEIMNHPSDDVLGIMFDRGAIHGCPYTSRDVRIMRKIYGPCVACVKGKTVRATPGPVINQWVAAHPGERLCIDIFFLSVVSRKGTVTSLPFLLVVDDYSEYVLITWLSSRTAATVMSALNEIIKFYYGHDWQVKEICGDRDTVFKPLKATLLDNKIELDIRATDQKIPRADRMIRTLRDIFRTVKATLWYKLPQFLYPHFFDDFSRVWNIRPNSRTIDRSPREIVEGKKLEFDQHVKVPVGTVGEFYIPQSKRDSTSKEDREVKKNEERTATGIVIGRNFDSTGTLDIYNIDTGNRVNRCKVKLVRQPSTALKQQIRALAPPNEVVENDQLLPVARLTQSTRSVSDARLDQPDPVVTDTEDRRGDTDASDPVVEQQQVPTEDEPPLSTDTAKATEPNEAAPTESIEKEQSTVQMETEDNDSHHGDESNNNEGLQQEATTSTDEPSSSSNSGPPTITTEVTESSRDSTDDPMAANYPRRPGLRKLQRDSKPTAPIVPPPSEPIRATRRNASKLPSRYCHLADETVDLKHQFQDYVFTAADNLTIRQAKTKYPHDHQNSLNAELIQFHDMQVGKPIKEMVKGLKHDKIIGCKGFYKEVFDLRTGQLKKLKFRIVPQGHLLNRNLYEPKETTSPTVSMESIFACINIAAYENRRGFTMDIPGAYLNAWLKDKHVVRFPRDLAAEYISLFPKFIDFLQPDGTLLMLIEKAWYGLVESSALWYTEIKAFLLALGYTTHPSDQGVFQKKNGVDTISICLWVDDFLGFSTNDTLIEELKKAVIDRYGDARFDDKKVLNFIGMTITQPDNGIVNVNQKEYIKKIIHESGVTKKHASPNHPNLMKRKDKSTARPLQSTTRYLSLLMSLMFLAKRTRPEILTPVCILAGRVQNPDEDDMQYLLRIFEYLNGSIDMGITYSPESLELFYWIDASYNLHHDSRGHSGIVVTMGRRNAPIYTKSQKQKLNTRSSTESELVATDEGVLHLLWLILVLDFLGYPSRPVTVFQDNKSTMRVCQTGQSKSGRLKHMVVRYDFIHGQQEANNITFEYIKSADMLADILSKPVDNGTFLRLRKRLLNLA